MSRRIQELTKADRALLIADGLCLHGINMDEEPCFEYMTKEEKNRASNDHLKREKSEE